MELRCKMRQTHRPDDSHSLRRPPRAVQQPPFLDSVLPRRHAWPRETTCNAPPTPNSSPMRACPGRTLPSAGPATGVQWLIGQPQQCPLGANTREGLAGMRKTKQGMGEVGPGGSRVEIRPEGLQRCLLSPQGSNPPERSAFLSPLGTQAGRCTPPSGVLR